MADHEGYKSVFQQAAELQPGAPHILAIEETDSVSSQNEGALVVIDIDDYEEDLRDRDWQNFLRRAATLRKELHARGHIS